MMVFYLNITWVTFFSLIFGERGSESGILDFDFVKISVISWFKNVCVKFIASLERNFESLEDFNLQKGLLDLKFL